MRAAHTEGQRVPDENHHHSGADARKRERLRAGASRRRAAQGWNLHYFLIHCSSLIPLPLTAAREREREGPGAHRLQRLSVLRGRNTPHAEAENRRWCRFSATKTLRSHDSHSLARERGPSARADGESLSPLSTRSGPPPAGPHSPPSPRGPGRRTAGRRPRAPRRRLQPPQQAHPHPRGARFSAHPARQPTAPALVRRRWRVYRVR